MLLFCSGIEVASLVKGYFLFFYVQNIFRHDFNETFKLNDKTTKNVCVFVYFPIKHIKISLVTDAGFEFRNYKKYHMKIKLLTIYQKIAPAKK